VPPTVPASPTTGYLVWHVAMSWRVATDRALSPLGLTNAQYAVLASLRGVSRAGTRPSQRELGEASGLEPMYVSKLVRSLESAGLLRRDRDPADPRVLRVALTARGEQVTEAAAGIAGGLLEELLAPLGGAGSPRSQELNQVLAVLAGHATAVNRAGKTAGEKEMEERRSP
jgi:MarR family transcriptional regulator, organic hydroperoxide resistance regulator